MRQLNKDLKLHFSQLEKKVIKFGHANQLPLQSSQQPKRYDQTYIQEELNESSVEEFSHSTNEQSWVPKSQDKKLITTKLHNENDYEKVKGSQNSTRA